MNLSSLNTGDYFERPYESDYSIIRRFSLVNSGLSKHQLKTEVDAILKPAHGSLETRILKILHNKRKEYLKDYFSVSYKNQRQCPECAKAVFHSDAYSLPWLTKCPIHKCKFTTLCPNCSEPWPKTHEILNGKCPNCSRLSLLDLENDPIDFMPSDATYVIGQLVPFLSFDKGIDTEHSEWNLKCIDIYNEYYPSIQAQSCKSLRDIAKKFEIDLKFINFRTFKHRAEKTEVQNFRQIWSSYLNIKSTDDFRFFIEDCRYQSFRKIIKWVKQQTKGHHHCKLMTYRYLAQRDFLNGPRFCPYCMAISLYYFFVESHPSHKNHLGKVVDADQYPFLSLLPGYDFFHYSSNFNHSFEVMTISLKYGDKFLSWFYQRCLLLIFRSIMYGVSLLYQNMRNTNQDHFITSYFLYGINKPPCFTEDWRLYRLDNLKSDVFRVFFVGADNPLEGLDLLNTNTSIDQCKNFSEYISTRYHDVSFFAKTINPDTFTLDHYLLLSYYFNEYLQRPPLHYSCYSPLHTRSPSPKK